MAEKFDLYWDASRPVLHEVLRAGMWSQGDDDEYDALTFEDMEPPTGLPPVRIRADNRQ